MKQPDFLQAIATISGAPMGMQILDALMPCRICNGKLWVCEDHLMVPWETGHECCGAAGAPCKCNPYGALPRGFEIIADVKP